MIEVRAVPKFQHGKRTEFPKLHTKTNMQKIMKVRKQLLKAKIAATPTGPPRFPSSEETRAAVRRRVILNAQKGQPKPRPKGDPPPKVPKSPDWSQLPDRPKKPLSVRPKGSAAVPTFSQETQKKVSLAVKALKGSRSLNQRLLICHYHLQSDAVLSGIDPRELLIELNSAS